MHIIKLYEHYINIKRLCKVYPALTQNETFGVVIKINNQQ